MKNQLIVEMEMTWKHAKVPLTEKSYWHTETTVRCNEIATFTYILRMHT